MKIQWQIQPFPYKRLEMRILKERLQLTKFSSLDSFSYFFLPRSIPSGASVFRVSLSRGKNREKHCITLIISVNQIERWLLLFGCRKCQPKVYNGDCPRRNRRTLWSAKRGFFLTQNPQNYGKREATKNRIRQASHDSHSSA